MRAVVVGAGPVGLYSGYVLAQAGHTVTIVDRDCGPDADGGWERKGVMQFRHPHFFRSIVRDVLVENAPELWDAVIAAGGIAASPPGAPPFIVNLQCRRWVFEQAVHNVVVAQPNLRFIVGHADRIEQSRGRVAGVVVDGVLIESDIVIDATGRAGRLGDDLRAPAESESCGFAYVGRMYQTCPGEPDLPPVGVPSGQLADGYLSILFPQDANTISTLFVRAEHDRQLADLRHRDAFDAAVRAVPNFAKWTDPDHFRPITDVMAGAGLTNSYRGQLNGAGDVALPGMFWVGDSVLTTNPAAGRGVALGLRQAATLLSMIEQDASDLAAVAAEFDGWCEQNLRPWFDDHVYWDATLLRRWAGADLDLDAKIPSDVVCAAAEVDPSILQGVGPYLGMMALPSVLDPFQDRVREILRGGWRPQYAAGPTRDELVELIAPLATASA